VLWLLWGFISLASAGQQPESLGSKRHRGVISNVIFRPRSVDVHDRKRKKKKKKEEDW
jgi:hypothetical protein